MSAEILGLGRTSEQPDATPAGRSLARPKVKAATAAGVARGKGDEASILNIQKQLEGMTTGKAVLSAARGSNGTRSRRAKGRISDQIHGAFVGSPLRPPAALAGIYLSIPDFELEEIKKTSRPSKAGRGQARSQRSPAAFPSGRPNKARVIASLPALNTGSGGRLGASPSIRKKKELSVNALGYFKTPRRPSQPQGPEVVERRPNSVTVRFALPFSDDSDDPEPEVVGFAVLLARTTLDLLLGNGIQRCCDSSGHPPPVTITDLVPGSSYYVRFRTQWSGGWSSWSEPSHVKKFEPAKPMAPNVSILARPNDIMLKWQTPTDNRDNGLPILEHEAIVWSNDLRRYKKGRGFRDRVCLETDLADRLRDGGAKCRFGSARFLDLLPRTTYSVKLRSRNKAGWSDWYAASVLTPMADGPPPPYNVQLSSQGNGWAEFQWQALRGVAGMNVVMFELQVLSRDGLNTVLRRERVHASEVEISTPLGRGQNEGTRKSDPARFFRGMIGHSVRLPTNQRLLFAVKAKNSDGNGNGHWSNPSDPLPFQSKATKFPEYLEGWSPAVKVLGSRNDKDPSTTSTGGAQASVVVVEWRAPDIDGGADIDAIEMRLRAFGDEVLGNTTDMTECSRIVCDPKVAAEKKKVTFRGLWPGARFTVSLRARNRRGWGKWSHETEFLGPPEPMPSDVGALVEAWWEGPWMRKDGWYQARVL
jgi:hypothetical protein